MLLRCITCLRRLELDNKTISLLTWELLVLLLPLYLSGDNPLRSLVTNVVLYLLLRKGRIVGVTKELVLLLAKLSLLVRYNLHGYCLCKFFWLLFSPYKELLGVKVIFTLLYTSLVSTVVTAPLLPLLSLAPFSPRCLCK